MEKLSVKSCLSYGWKTFSSSPLIFLGVSLLILVANILVSGVQFGIEFLGGQVAGESGLATTVTMLVSTLIGMAISFAISLWQTVFYLRAHETTENIDLRSFWRPELYWKFVGASMILGVLLLVGFLLLIIPGIFLSIIFGFALYLVIEERLSPIDALKESARLTKGHRWQIFALGAAIIGINILGLIALIVGLLVTIPVSTLAMIHAYRTLKDWQLPAVIEGTTVESA